MFCTFYCLVGHLGSTGHWGGRGWHIALSDSPHLQAIMLAKSLSPDPEHFIPFVGTGVLLDTETWLESVALSELVLQSIMDAWWCLTYICVYVCLHTHMCAYVSVCVYVFPVFCLYLQGCQEAMFPCIVTRES